MPNGDEKNWTRLCIAVASFWERYGAWPETARLCQGVIEAIEQHCLTKNQFNYLKTRLEIISEPSFVIQVEKDGLALNYEASNLPNGDWRERVEEWLLGDYVDEVAESEPSSNIGMFFSADGKQVAGPPADPNTLFQIKAINADFKFTELLERHGIKPADVLVMRHRPAEPVFASQARWVAHHREDVFMAYQSTQNKKEDSQLRRHRYLASFLADVVGEAIFVGLYEIGEPRQHSTAEIEDNQAMSDLANKFKGFQVTPKRNVFPMDPVIEFKKYKGRLVIGWSGGVHGSRSWSRPAKSNASKGYPIFAIHPESIFSEPPSTPDWREVVLTIEEMKSIPQQWQDDFSKWRAIYYIFDVSDGKGYVGSACGEENLWGRWSDYIKTGHGGNNLLKGRDPSNFRFSILQGVSPDHSSSEIIPLENMWKARLHTLTHGLNNN